MTVIVPGLAIVVTAFRIQAARMGGDGGRNDTQAESENRRRQTAAFGRRRHMNPLVPRPKRRVVPPIRQPKDVTALRGGSASSADPSQALSRGLAFHRPRAPPPVMQAGR